MTKIKLCGIRTIEGARACQEAKPDWVGLNFVPTSKRKVSLEEAKRLLPELGGIPAVGVFMNQSLEAIEEIARSLPLAWIQLHGRETPEFCRELSSYRLIKAFSIREGFSPAILEPYAPWVEHFLFDAPLAGSGISFDWRLLSQVEGLPFLLAGGLNPENVQEAIRSLHPFGVDTASGIEREGVSAPERIQDFCRKARDL